mmetsp:Transcript_9209/g.26182  ORF Transcript_9209/g.26182 Transcript_9209/m.26182 type:complete len:208 (+) Transcript_9209:153-776(+)
MARCGPRPPPRDRSRRELPAEFVRRAPPPASQSAQPNHVEHSQSKRETLHFHFRLPKPRGVRVHHNRRAHRCEGLFTSLSLLINPTATSPVVVVMMLMMMTLMMKMEQRCGPGSPRPARERGRGGPGEQRQGQGRQAAPRKGPRRGQEGPGDSARQEKEKRRPLGLLAKEDSQGVQGQQGKVLVLLGAPQVHAKRVQGLQGKDEVNE